MCIIGTVRDSLSVGITTMAPVVPTLTSSSSSNNLVQIMKPKLPRKLTRTPRINLNKYWNILEDMMSNDGSDSSRSNNRQEVITAPLRPNNQNERLFEDLDMNNEINENISNEQKENDNILVRNNEANTINRQCTCNSCLITELRNISVTDRCEDVTEL